MPSINTYSLSTIRGELLTEFGLDATADQAMVDAIINRAIHWIVRQRESWPWLIRELVINVQPALSGSADFRLGSVGVSLKDPASQGTVAPYFIIQNGVINGDLIDGYLVISQQAGGTGIELDAQFLAAATGGSVLPYTAVQGYYPLPTNFGRAISISSTDFPEQPLEYVQPEVFEKLRRRVVPLSIGGPFVYTIIPDPLSASSGNLYISFFPYPSDRQTVRGLYYAEPENLDLDADVPIIPIKNRLVLFHVAAWMLATKLKHDSGVVTEYRATAFDVAQRMRQEYEFSDDTNRGRRRHRSILGNFELDLPIRE